MVIKNVDMFDVYNLLNEDKGVSFTAIDFETANNHNSSACSVGLVKVVNGKITDSQHFLINPPEEHRVFSRYTVAVHGITKKMVANAPSFKDIYDDLYDFIDNDTLIAHNASFDSRILKGVCQHYELSTPKTKFGCTLKLARVAFPGLSSYTLPAVVQQFSSESFQHHDALADSKACAEILINVAQKKNLNSVDEVFKKHRVEFTII